MGLKIWVYGIILVISVIFMGVKRGLLNVVKRTFRRCMWIEAFGELSEREENDVAYG
jgi:hypothetical protein